MPAHTLTGEGGRNATYARGVQQIEAFARYSHVLSQREIAAFCVAAAAKGEERERPW